MKRFRQMNYRFCLDHLHRKKQTTGINLTATDIFCLHYLKIKRAMDLKKVLPKLEIAYFEAFVTKGELTYDAVWGALGRNCFNPIVNESPEHILNFGCKPPGQEVVYGIKIDKLYQRVPVVAPQEPVALPIPPAVVSTSDMDDLDELCQAFTSKCMPVNKSKKPVVPTHFPPVHYQVDEPRTVEPVVETVTAPAVEPLVETVTALAVEPVVETVTASAVEPLVETVIDVDELCQAFTSKWVPEVKSSADETKVLPASISECVVKPNFTKELVSVPESESETTASKVVSEPELVVQESTLITAEPSIKGKVPQPPSNQ